MFVSGLQAQDYGFQPGYIVTNSNDTIPGTLKYANLVPYRLLEKIKFRPNDDEKTQIYPPDKLLGYMCAGKIFHSVKDPDSGEKEFMELLIDGRLKLYTYTVSSFGASTHPNNSSRYLLKTGTDTPFAIRIGNFKKGLSAYLSDNVALSEKIKSGEYKKSDLEKIVREYNGQPEK